MRLIKTSLALALGCSLSLSAIAETKSSSFDSRVQVVATCSVSAADLDFGSITTGVTPDVDAASTISVNCSAGAPYEVSLSNGANFSDSRRMAWGGSYVGYRLYSNAARTQEWDGTNTVLRTGTGASELIDVFGRIFAGQNIPNMGSYADTIVATVSY